MDTPHSAGARPSSGGEAFSQPASNSVFGASRAGFSGLGQSQPAAGESSFCAAAARRGINVAAMIDAVAALITSFDASTRVPFP